jgi:hypothetical protein
MEPTVSKISKFRIIIDLILLSIAMATFQALAGSFTISALNLSPWSPKWIVSYFLFGFGMFSMVFLPVFVIALAFTKITKSLSASDAYRFAIVCGIGWILLGSYGTWYGQRHINYENATN